MRMPIHLKRNPIRLTLLRMEAMGLRGLFGAPVYLVGSALEDENSDPRDWDIRIKLPDRVFAIRYGKSKDYKKTIQQWIYEGHTGDWTRIRFRWSDECCKYSRRASEFLNLPVDVQIYPATQWEKYRERPRYRLDRPLSRINQQLVVKLLS